MTTCLFAGVDDVFVFINTFRQASHVTDLGERMLYTVRTAGKATFFTSFTTAAAFAANVFSAVCFHTRRLSMHHTRSLAFMLFPVDMPGSALLDLLAVLK